MARDFGRVAAFKPHHAPFALRRTLLDELTKRYADEVEATMHHRFRHPDDLSVAASLAGNYGIATGQAVTDRCRSSTCTSSRHGFVGISIGCGWDAASTRSASTRRRRRRPIADRAATSIADFLAEYFPVPAPWERDEPSP